MTKKVYLVDGRRTAFGRFGGSLKSISPVELGTIASKAAMEAAGVGPDQICHVVMGNVCQSTTDTIYLGRHVGLKAGCPQKTPGYTVNRLCGSGIQAILDAFRMVKIGEAKCVLAGGSENMSMIPHLVYGGRFGTKYGPLKTVDMLTDSLVDQYAQIPMGLTAEKLSANFSVNREACDQYALDSHIKASKAYSSGKYEDQIHPVEVKGKEIKRDEHLREDVSMDAMTGLRPSFQKNGVVTAANASGIVDGAASVIVASEEFVSSNGLNPIAEIVDGFVIGVDPTVMGIGPSPAIKGLLEKNKLSLSEIDLFEINEAFAGQVLSCMKDADIPADKLNIWGGAVALGHPLGATGTRITLTLAKQLVDTDSKLGVASACIGGGQGISVLLRK